MSPKIITRYTFFITGALFLVLAHILNTYDFKLGYDILINFSFVFISFVLVDILWSVARKDLRRFKEKKYGLVNVYKNPNNIAHKFFVDEIRNAKRNIDLMGYTLSYISMSREICQYLKDKLNSGLKVRIVLPSPENLIFNEANNFRYLLHPESTKSKLQTSIDIFREFNQPNFELKLVKKCPISYFIRRVDEKIYIIHYVWNIETEDSPVYEIKRENSILFQTYIKSFENLLIVHE
ncbi:hypothetical protein JW964_11230 [candidate division KSB1 bacterium]|nr:hypothetical protein [candidate division KSB1 bacterium]